MDGRLILRRLPALVALAAALGTGAAACYVPYPVPAGTVVDRTPSGPAEADPGWGGSGCALTLRQEVLERVNALRRERGLGELRPQPELVEAAEAHAADQARQDRVTHRGSSGSAAAERAEAAGYAYAGVGENVAGGYASPEAVVRAWLDSPGHRAIMLAPEPRHAAVGYAYRADGRLHHLWTLMVGTPGPAETTPVLACHP